MMRLELEKPVMKIIDCILLTFFDSLISDGGAKSFNISFV